MNSNLNSIQTLFVHTHNLSTLVLLSLLCQHAQYVLSMNLLAAVRSRWNATNQGQEQYNHQAGKYDTPFVMLTGDHDQIRF
ncbi:hypothetical protein B0J11DRAFT_531226 [Dendryphion nanum]|uniref:Uncharacterized protein n=1 Tax=Dendryphion nanum TaxID=256645 RepID=A0A9P9DNF1_9PLEO|nr:hypothetical protein B0J11DRAFT_531226 [Dendryphion nanum]